MRRRMTWLVWFGFGGGVAALAMVLLCQIPPIRHRVDWRLDAAMAEIRGWLRPGDTVPVPAGAMDSQGPTPAAPTRTPPAPPAPTPTSTPGPTPTPLPESVVLEPPEWEKQDWNNCGPATLALALRYFGWDGDQQLISDLIKPDRGDRNVNIDELAYYVRTRAGWLGAEFRVGGTLETLKRFVAAGFPVIVEKGTTIDEGGGGWAGHYALVTGYDDGRGVFITQDTYRGPDQDIAYPDLDANWKAFNRAYMLVFPVEDAPRTAALFGEDLDPDLNRQRAMEMAQKEIEADSKDAFAWFNLGSNLVYFERYGEAAQAYDTALSLGLPWRFTRYQFGPYIAYFHQGRFEDIIELADATLYRTSKAEESLLWRGWAHYRMGDWALAVEDFRVALKINPNYLDAQYALDYIGAAP